jgi:hypothetical protein
MSVIAIIKPSPKLPQRRQIKRIFQLYTGEEIRSRSIYLYKPSYIKSRRDFPPHTKPIPELHSSNLQIPRWARHLLV